MDKQSGQTNQNLSVEIPFDIEDAKEIGMIHGLQVESKRELPDYFQKRYDQIKAGLDLQHTEKEKNSKDRVDESAKELRDREASRNEATARAEAYRQDNKSPFIARFLVLVGTFDLLTIISLAPYLAASAASDPTLQLLEILLLDQLISLLQNEKGYILKSIYFGILSGVVVFLHIKSRKPKEIQPIFSFSKLRNTSLIFACLSAIFIYAQGLKFEVSLLKIVSLVVAMSLVNLFILCMINRKWFAHLARRLSVDYRYKAGIILIAFVVIAVPLLWGRQNEAPGLTFVWTFGLLISCLSFFYGLFLMIIFNHEAIKDFRFRIQCREGEKLNDELAELRAQNQLSKVRLENERVKAENAFFEAFDNAKLVIRLKDGPVDQLYL